MVSDGLKYYIMYFHCCLYVGPCEKKSCRTGRFRIPAHFMLSDPSPVKCGLRIKSTYRIPKTLIRLRTLYADLILGGLHMSHGFMFACVFTIQQQDNIDK